MKPSFTELREHLLVQKKSLEDDGFGGVRARWEDHKSLWAKVEFASSKDITTRSLRDVVKGDPSLRKSLYRLTLRVDHQRPAPCPSCNDSIVHREGIRWQTSDIPLSDGHRLAKEALE